METIS